MSRVSRLSAVTIFLGHPLLPGYGRTAEQTTDR
jgi:hypothetical protein